MPVLGPADVLDEVAQLLAKGCEHLIFVLYGFWKVSEG